MFNFKRYSSNPLLIAMLFTLLLSLTLTAKANTATQNTQQRQQQAETVLDALHHHAAAANWDEYFALYTPNGTFIGTDVGEHWTIPEFEQYARPTKGWRYELTERKMTMQDKVIWFDEILMSAAYGVCRGTGTLIMTDTGWKIAQYHLSFPIPNEIAKEITSRIKKVGN